MRNRSSTIIVKDGNIAVIKRSKPDQVYYVFPGGGIEENETPEQAALRETYEELGITVEIERLLHTFPYSGIQYYFLAIVKAGEFGTGKGEEYLNSSIDKGTYEPMWLPLKDLSLYNIRPKELVKIIQENCPS